MGSKRMQGRMPLTYSPSLWRMRRSQVGIRFPATITGLSYMQQRYMDVVPFGTLSDDPGEPGYPKAVIGHLRSLWSKSPMSILGEVGGVMP